MTEYGDTMENNLLLATSFSMTGLGVGTQLDPNFVYVSQSMNWPSAQRFCRENFVDLASVRNKTENQSILKSWSSGHFPWLGLYRDPNVYWSDGSSFLFSNWYNGKIPLGSMRIVCGVTSIQLSGSWKLLSCETRLPFVCYKLPGECFYRFFVKD
uniref:C-type lectin domain-containing protein n=1 Tax=Kryptolebias marmoratus TaxID=37003 RepID=A0A3Q3BE86_KRYMA